MRDPETRQIVSEPEREAEPGFHWEAHEAEGWRVSDGLKTCRQQGCTRDAEAELNRRLRTKNDRVDSWWAYCDSPGHMYDKWVEGSRVMCWRMVPDG